MKKKLSILICATFVLASVFAQEQSRACDFNQYGSFCDGECNCVNDEICDQSTGHCPNGCKNHYKPPICETCDDGYFGGDCNQQCRCLNGPSDCDLKNGNCKSGKCSIGYEGKSCQKLTGFPKFESSGIDSSVNKNQTFIVTCTAVGAPLTNITINYNNLTAVEDVGVTPEDGNKTTASVELFSDIIGLHDIECKAVNIHGSVSEKLNITVVDPPELKKPPHVDSKRAAREIKVSWDYWEFKVDKGGFDKDEINYLVVYRYTGSKLWINSGNWQPENTHTITNLTPDTDYEIAIRCKRPGDYGEGGVKEYSNANTICEPPNENGTVQNISSRIIAPSIVQLNWQPPKQENLGCSLKSFSISYQQIWPLTPLLKSTVIVNEDQLNYEFLHLVPQSAYLFELTAITTELKNSSSVSYTVNTTYFVPGQVTNLTLQEIPDENYQLRVNWSRPANVTAADDKYIDYTVTVKLLEMKACGSSNEKLDNITILKNSTTEAFVSNLYPYSEYKISVQAKASAGASNSIELTANTTEGAPSGVPSMIVVEEIGLDSLLFRWDPVPCEQANGQLGYRYSLRLFDEGQQNSQGRKKRSDEWSGYNETNDNNVTIVNLSIYTEYEFSLRGFTSAGDGPAKTIVKRTSENTAPKLSEPPMVTNVEKSEITVEWRIWNSSSNETNGIPEYKVFYRLKDPTWLEKGEWQSENSSTIYNLTQDSEYEISVRVRNNGNEGPIGPTIASRTKCGLLSDYANRQNATLQLLSHSSVEISWEPPKIRCRYVNYSLTFETIATSEILAHNLTGNTVGFVRSGLRLNTGYLVNLTALTTLGEVYKYTQLFFNTSDFHSDAMIDNSPLQIKSVNATYLHFALVSRALVTNSNKNITYKILVKLQSKIACNTILNQLSSQTINTTVNDIVTISNLSPYSIYEFSVEIVTMAEFNKSFELKANTTEAAPYVNIVNISLMGRDVNKLSFKWDPIPCDVANGQLSYQYSLLEHRETGALIKRKKRQTTWIPVVSDIVTNDTNVTFDNLTIFTTYEFRVKAFTSAGETLTSNTTQRTAEDIPLPPNLSMNKSTSNSFLFDIISSLPLRGIVIGHEIEVSNCLIERNPCNEDSTSPIISFNVSNLQPLVENLLPFSSWDVKIRAKTKVGWGNWSSTFNFTTDEGFPGEPGFIEILEINSTAVQVRLKPPNRPNGIILTYKVNCYLWNNENQSFYSNPLITIETDNNYGTLVFLNGLKIGSTYIIQALARTKAGYGAISNDTFVMSGAKGRKTVVEYPPPPTPQLIKYIRGQDFSDEITIEAKIFAVQSTSGIRPKYYQVIVKKLELGDNEAKLNDTSIAGYNRAMSANTPYWTAALIAADSLPLDESISFIVGDKKYYDGFYNGPIFKNFTYTVMSRIFIPNNDAFSLFTPMALQPKEGDSKVAVHGPPCIIAGISCIWFIAIVIIVVLLFWIIVAIVVFCKRRRRTKRLSISEGTMNNSIKARHQNNIWPKKIDGSNADDTQDTSLTVFQSSDSSLQSGRSKTFNKNCNFFGPILVKDLAEYINQRAANSKIDFPEEYKQATRDKSKPWTIAKKPENLKKNRYGNILPYDMTRVRLDPHPGQPDTDYINASFIDGYDKPKGYIATQGPKENTFQDFWRMVWQENAVVIVMLTALVECRKKKCDQYWPNNSRLYGNILVTLTSTEHLADIIIRHFDIKSIEAAEIREVTHYHYTDWPDFSLPPCITSVLNLRRKVREEMQKRVSRSPFIVHCSGGAGRTGTFIAIDAMLNQSYEEDRINVFRFTGVMWGCRCNLIQNADQYRFVYDAVLEALQSGDTKVICNRLPTYYRDICRTSECEPSDLAEQFNILNRLERRSSCFSCPEASNEENTKKNRNQEILPIEHSRVRLRSIYEPVFEEDETEEDRQPSTADPYINAVFVDGFKLKRQFLVTHMPLDETVQDFWRMIVLNKSSVIVMLNDCEFIDENTVPGQYWPNEGCIQYGPYQVEVVQFEEMGMVTLRTLRVIDTRKVNEFMPLGVMQLQFLDWIPDKKVPAAVSSILSLINFADVYRHKYGGPITLHCQDGASRCGVFCAAYNVKEQIETGEVDIFQTIKRLRRHRPQFITSIEQYQFCYEIATARVAELNKDSTLSTLV